MQIELLREKVEDRLKAAVLEIAIPKLIAEYVHAKVFKYLKETERDRIQDDFILMNIWYESRYKGNLQKRFKEMYAEVLANMKKKGFKVAHARYKEDFDAGKWLFNRKAWYGTLTADGKALTASPVQRGGNFELGELGISTTFDMEDPRVIEWIATNSKNAAFAITNTQYEKLRRIMMDAIADGEGIPAIRERIVEQLGLELKRAEMIARTEVLKASNRGILLAMHQSGVVEGKEWIATIDAKTCFLAGTKVMTEAGEKNIEDIKEGEFVLSHLGSNRVAKTFKREYTGDMTKIEMPNGRTLTATSDHPIFEIDKGWREAGELHSNEKLQSSLGETITILTIDTFYGNCKSVPLFVYNIEVEKAHTYYAEDVLVHNCPMCAEMDGRTMPLGEPFYEQSSDPVIFHGTEQTPAPEGGLSYVFDYEEIQHPVLHPDCRCTLLAILRKV